MITDYQANKWLDELSTVWLGLHSSNPDINGDLASEISGRGYERVSMNFTDPDQRIIWNKKDAKFKGMPSCTVAFISGWTNQYNGRMLFYIPAKDTERVQAGQTYLIKSGHIAISIG